MRRFIQQNINAIEAYLLAILALPVASYVVWPGNDAPSEAAGLVLALTGAVLILVFRLARLRRL